MDLSGNTTAGGVTTVFLRTQMQCWDRGMNWIDVCEDGLGIDYYEPGQWRNQHGNQGQSGKRGALGR